MIEEFSLRKRRRVFYCPKILIKVEPMPTQKKIDEVEKLGKKLAESNIVVATDHTGLDGSAMTELRRKMRDSSVEYRVVKNTLAYLAAESADMPQVREVVSGPTALAFGYQDPITVAKALEEYIKVNRSPLAIRGAILQGRVLTPAQVTALATLPPREVLMAQLLGQFKQPLVGLVSQLQAPMYRLLSALNGPVVSLSLVLQQRIQQMESQEGA